MPLMHGKSKAAFSHNVSAEMHAGKPQKQAVAIAYSEKQQAQKMAEGGEAGMEGGANWILDQVAHEIMRAIEDKNPRQLCDALGAFMMHLQMEDEMQDEQEMD